MRFFHHALFAACLLAPSSSAPPNFLIIVIDDYGWNNIGIHARDQANAAEVRTPALDALAASGVVLDRFYTFSFCSPSRSALHTGRNPIHVNILNSDLAAVNLSDPVSGFAGIPRNMTAFPERLAQDANYETVQVGKCEHYSVCLFFASFFAPASPHHFPPAFPQGTRAWRRPSTRRAAAATKRAFRT